MLKFWAGLTAGVTLICAGYALASRNSAGSMSAINGPYVAGTTINPTIVNARLSDIETEITNSLDRSGRGGMLASLRGVDGTVAAPAFSFTSETGSGLYRIGAGDLGWAISGGKKLELTSALFTVTPNALFSGQLGVGAAAPANQAVYAKGVGNHGYIAVDTDTPASKETGINLLSNGVQKWEMYIPAGTTDLRFFNGSDRLTLTSSTMTVAPALAATGGVTVGSAGTAITTLTTGTITLSGGGGTATVASGAKCVCGTNNLQVKCSVAATTLTATGTGSDVITYICT